MRKNLSDELYDYVVIGSGFGGSVSALRLVEKGYKVLLIEKGRRYRPKDFPKTNWNLRKWLWAPSFFCYGIQQISLLNNALILSGTGYGGGSLVYANTLLEPPDGAFYQDERWRALQLNWKADIAPFYKKAKQMLGVVTHPFENDADKLLKQYAGHIGRSEWYKKSQVGVLFGEKGKRLSDPYFGGEGPDRYPCTGTGHCMVGCRDGGKNTLDKNYLYLAEKKGLDVLCAYQVDTIVREGELYRISCKPSKGFLFKKRLLFRTKGIVLSAGTLGTLDLLLKNKQAGNLPDLSERLGETTRTNSEVMTGYSVGNPKKYDFSGISITSGVYVDDDTHIEVVRYPSGSDVMSVMTVPLINRGKMPRPIKLLGYLFKHPIRMLKSKIPFGWARRSVVLLVMQSLDNQLKLIRKRVWWSPWKRRLASENRNKKSPTYIQQANDAAEWMANQTGGLAQSAATEVLLNVPVTAHLIGGAVMGNSKEDGVIDKYHRVFGYPNFYIIDGSSVPVNLGVNPSLTITAMAERAMSHIVDRSEASSC